MLFLEMLLPKTWKRMVGIGSFGYHGGKFELDVQQLLWDI